MNHSLPIGGVAVVILVIFLHLPMEKQDLKTKLKRVDYAGTYDDEMCGVCMVVFLLGNAKKAIFWSWRPPLYSYWP